MTDEIRMIRIFYLEKFFNVANLNKTYLNHLQTVIYLRLLNILEHLGSENNFIYDFCMSMCNLAGEFSSISGHLHTALLIPLFAISCTDDKVKMEFSKCHCSNIFSEDVESHLRYMLPSRFS